MVIGENRKFPAALVVPAFKALAHHFQLEGLRFSTNIEAIARPEVHALIDAEIRRLNQHFGRYSQVKKFVLLKEEWSIAGGELTPTLKLKRRQVLKKYAKEIESLYAAERQNESADGTEKLQAGLTGPGNPPTRHEAL